MPIHDWTRVDAGTFHAFHGAWITHLMGTLNAGVLPEGYYALQEQVTLGVIPDVVTLRDDRAPELREAPGDVALATLPTQRLRVRPSTPPKPRPQVRQVVIRRASGHQTVAIIEIVSPSNKDRRDSVRELSSKVERLLRAGVHILLIDLLPPTRHDPRGMHGAVWARFDRKRYRPPEGEPLTLASYRWDEVAREPEAILEPIAVGRTPVPMPLFLSAVRCVDVPLEPTYAAAFAAMPKMCRDVLEASTGE